MSTQIQIRIVMALEAYRQLSPSKRDRIFWRELAPGYFQVFFNNCCVDLQDGYVRVNGDQAEQVRRVLMAARLALPCARSNYGARTILEQAA